MSNAINVSMKTFKTLATRLSPDVTLCVRGRHAVGKSEGVYQAAAAIFDDFYKSDAWLFIRNDPTLPHELRGHTYEEGLPVIERRLSQMSEGDIVGLPFMHDNKRTGGKSTSFKPCDWLINAQEFPVMLFLDERNRALEGVKQAVFQLTDSKAFYGNKLHPNTRIIVAENVGDSYQVQECDPAEVSRCATVQLEPTVEEWLDYAVKHCDTFTTDFVREHGQSVLEYIGTNEPGKKYPDRRTWFKLDRELVMLDEFNKPTEVLHAICCAFLGSEIGSKFSTYVRSRDRNVTAQEILQDWDKAKKKLGGAAKQTTAQQFIACAGKVGDFLTKNNTTTKITDLNAVNIACFMFDMPEEVRQNFYQKYLSVAGNEDTMFKVHPLIKDLVVATRTGADSSKLARPSVADFLKSKGIKATSVTEETATAPKRGSKKV